MIRWRSLRWFLLLFPLLLGNPPTLAGEEISPKRQVELRHLLWQDCGSCHGLTLKGGLGPPLLPADLAGKSAEFLIDSIAFGRTGTAMPPWLGLLSREEIAWLVTYLLNGDSP